MASADEPANDGTPQERSFPGGAPRSLRCSPGCARMAAPQVEAPSVPVGASCVFVSLHLPGSGAGILSSWGGVLLQLHLVLLRTSTVVECSIERSRCSLRPQATKRAGWSPAGISHHCATKFAQTCLRLVVVAVVVVIVVQAVY